MTEHLTDEQIEAALEIASNPPLWPMNGAPLSWHDAVDGIFAAVPSLLAAKKDAEARAQKAEAEARRLTGSLEIVEQRLCDLDFSSEAEDRAQLALGHVEAALAGYSRPFALLNKERDEARAERDRLRAELADAKAGIVDQVLDEARAENGRLRSEISEVKDRLRDEMVRRTNIEEERDRLRFRVRDRDALAARLASAEAKLAAVRQVRGRAMAFGGAAYDRWVNVAALDDALAADTTPEPTEPEPCGYDVRDIPPCRCGCSVTPEQEAGKP